MSRPGQTVRLALLALWSRAALAQGGGPDDPTDEPPAAALEVALVDRMVAVVGDRLVTQRDLDIEGLLSGRDHSPLEVLEARRSDPLAYLVDLAVLRGLAGNVSVYRPSSADVQARVDGVREAFDKPEDFFAALAALELTEQDLASRLLTRMVVERYVLRNLVLRADGPARPGDGGTSSAETDAQYLAWMDELRNGVDIRYVEGPLGR